MSPRKDDCHQFPEFGVSASAAIVRLFGSKGGVARNSDQALKYMEEGANHVGAYVAEKMLEELKTNPKLKQFFECSIEHRDENFIQYDRTAIFDVILADSKLVHKFGIPNSITQRERDFYTIWSGYNYYEFHNEPLREAKKLVHSWGLHPKIKELGEKVNKSPLIILLKAREFQRVFLGSPTPERLEEQKKARELILTCLKG
jgi:hypothetical protein